MSSSASKVPFHSLKAVRVDGEILQMKAFMGMVVYATNISSVGALADKERAQFKKLAETHGNNLAILVFPNDIAKFDKTEDFPGILMKLGNVQGEHGITDVWKFFMDEARDNDPDLRDSKVRFSTNKILVSKDGEVSYTNAHDLETDIERLVNERSQYFGMGTKRALR